MQVIGLCRFSYPAHGGFQVEHDTVDERTAYLYAPERMEERFALFENLTLPGIRAQSDPEFTFVVVIGDSLPLPYRDRLQNLCANVPQIQIREEAPARHRPIMRRILNEARHDREAPCLQFRLDDDDAVAVDFVADLRAAARGCAGLLRQSDYVAFDFNTGYLVRAEAGDMLVAEVTRPYQTAALAVYVAAGATKSVMNFSHHQIFHHMPTVTLNTPGMFLRSHNRFNDSRQKPVKAEELHPITTAERRLFQRCFAIGATEIDQLCAFSRRD